MNRNNIINLLSRQFNIISRDCELRTVASQSIQKCTPIKNHFSKRDGDFVKSGKKITARTRVDKIDNLKIHDLVVINDFSRGNSQNFFIGEITEMTFGYELQLYKP